MMITVAAQHCSEVCSCSFNPAAPFWIRVNCSNRKLAIVPKDLPREARYLDLSNNRISSIDAKASKRLNKLVFLDLSNSGLHSISPSVFHGLYDLQYLFLQRNFLKEIPLPTFKQLSSLKLVKVDTSSLCCYVTKYHNNVTCEYPKEAGDAVSDCKRMIQSPTARKSIWLLGILAVLGNLAVIAWRLIRRDDHPVQTCLLTNLAVSDFLMGVYLMIIAILDNVWAGDYFSHDITWRSEYCKLAGALSVLSSEVSVLMLTIITADRLISIVFAFKCSRLTLKGSYVICGAVWICGAVIAIVPCFDIPYFYNNDRHYGYYGRSSVCLPLQLSPKRLAGWEYSVGVFIALNLTAFLFIVAAYITIIVKVFKSQQRVKAHGESEMSSNNIKRESALARKVFAIILTDFSCWFPVIIVSILALVGRFHDGKGEAYVIFAVFVLPVNSSINPVLYTFSTPKVRSVLKGWSSSLLVSLRKRISRSYNLPDFTKRPNTKNKTKESVKEKKFSLIMEEIKSDSKNEVQPENNGNGSIDTIMMDC
ncbi:G-protein coupled receptor GRL101-like isoform X2 [Oculina patagonica]